MSSGVAAWQQKADKRQAQVTSHFNRLKVKCSYPHATILFLPLSRVVACRVYMHSVSFLSSQSISALCATPDFHYLQFSPSISIVSLLT